MTTALLARRGPDSPQEWLIFIGIFVAVILLTFYLQRRRRKAMENAAREMGFTFQADAAGLGPAAYLNLPLLSRNTALTNVLQGALSCGETVVLDCQIGSGKSAQTQTVACFRLSGKDLPAFEMRPENMLHKIGSLFGYKDIDFDQNEAFSKSYLLRGADESAVRLLFHSGWLSFFEQRKGWSVEGAGEWLAVYRVARTVSPSKLRQFVEDATQVATAFL
jgi:LPXTG-motif cell wall-anchored protein